ncbi:efflux RND transporter permease subunit [Actinoplanes sp. NPDC051859]|uniref:MMPL family transporter n=1 Tax=Actinoplanes sp. NPDC051859 TaxID=3363909 RepID=UPI00379536E3
MSRFRWAVLLVTVAAVAGAGVWGFGVFGQLSEGGYTDPGSESSQAADVAAAELGSEGADVVVIYRPAKGTIDDAALSARIQERLGALPKSVVTEVGGYWHGKAAQFAAADRKSAVAVLTLAGDDDGEKLESYREIDDKLTVAGATAQLTGEAPLNDAASGRSTRDLAFAEAISLPVVLILLLFIFGSLVAASLPVLVGGCAVLGSLGVLHAVANSHDVNSFAVNVASLLGLGMAIDYGLFMVGRFREEQASGRTPAEAVIRTVATAGRTVVFSASLLMIALAGLLLFPQGFLKSLAYGGLAAVALAALLSLTLLPALLAVLGPRVDKLPVRLPRRTNRKPEGSGWTALARFVLRRPVLVALPILAGLLILAVPIKGVQFGESDERVLPEGDAARVAVETLKADYPALSSSGIQIVVLGGNGPPKGLEPFAQALDKIPGIAAATPAGAGGKAVTYVATLRGSDPFSQQARTAVEKIRALPAPAGTKVFVGGTTARSVDSISATAERLPLMVGLLVGATLILMFLAFGSILLPVKAVLMSALSLGATFGILVWIFQDGHGASLLQITPAPLEVGIVVLMAAVVFGLSTDYEVFLLSRMVEARTRGASTAEAVSTGLSRTGRVISAAAILLIVVTGAFALSTVTTMRFVGVGMIVALFLDATVVRMLLVPAVLRLMGDAAWWAPGPLRRLQQRAGLAEYEHEDAGDAGVDDQSGGRHAVREPAGLYQRPDSLAAADTWSTSHLSPASSDWASSPTSAWAASPDSARDNAPPREGYRAAPEPASAGWASETVDTGWASESADTGWVSGAVVPGLPVAGSAPVPMPERMPLAFTTPEEPRSELPRRASQDNYRNAPPKSARPEPQVSTSSGPAFFGPVRASASVPRHAPNTPPVPPPPTPPVSDTTNDPMAIYRRPRDLSEAEPPGHRDARS